MKMKSFGILLSMNDEGTLLIQKVEINGSRLEASKAAVLSKENPAIALLFKTLQDVLEEKIGASDALKHILSPGSDTVN